VTHGTGPLLLDQFAKSVLDLEKSGSSAAAVQQLLRLAHTLKGAARVVRQSQIADRAHAIEDALSPFRDGAKGFAREQIDTVLAHLDEIDGHIATLAQGDAADHAGDGHVVADDASRTVRTDVAETDAVLDGVAETHALLNGLRSAGQGLEQAKHLAELLMAQLAPQRTPLGPADTARQSGGRDHLLATGGELRRKLGRVERDLGSTVDQMDRELRQLRDAAERLRLGPAASLLTALERAVRNVARKTSKHVKFEGGGGDIRLDAHVIETIQGALVQLVRNAVAHGIEPESERRAAGKPAVGCVGVNVVRRGRSLVFECRDDGRGLDLDGVRRVAVERGIVPSRAQEPSAEDLVRMLLRGGISTSKTVTEVSGRGVGLDVVREAVERLGGEIVVRTNAGTGTTFELVIPPSLAAMDALMVEAEGTVAALPLRAVRSTLRIATPDISLAAAGASIVHGHKTIAFIPLSAACGGAQSSKARNWTAIVVAAGAGLDAIGVDRLLGTGRIVVRPLPDGMSASPIVAGALLDAEGNPQLVLDPDGLVAAALGANRDWGSAHSAAPRRLPVLVVDDSLTTRMLEQSILESAGYDVDVALSGEEAIACVTRKSYALILVDVEMPGMDGFTFIERIRAEPTLRHIPAILVTSRAAPEDRRRGREVGAQGYIVKSAFDQAELLTLIRSLTG
jgi:two-component system chemotaxis sensor kinase CheA